MSNYGMRNALIASAIAVLLAGGAALYHFVDSYAPPRVAVIKASVVDNSRLDEIRPFTTSDRVKLGELIIIKPPESDIVTGSVKRKPAAKKPAPKAPVADQTGSIAPAKPAVAKKRTPAPAVATVATSPDISAPQ
jgi:hypothetical protein